jgi:hypothetical protein
MSSGLEGGIVFVDLHLSATIKFVQNDLLAHQYTPYTDLASHNPSIWSQLPP